VREKRGKNLSTQNRNKEKKDNSYHVAFNFVCHFEGTF